jgi:hypothetical protein
MNTLWIFLLTERVLLFILKVFPDLDNLDDIPNVEDIPNITLYPDIANPPNIDDDLDIAYDQNIDWPCLRYQRCSIS